MARTLLTLKMSKGVGCGTRAFYNNHKLCMHKTNMQNMCCVLKKWKSLVPLTWKIQVPRMNVFEQTKTSLSPRSNNNATGATRHCQSTALLQDRLNKSLSGWRNLHSRNICTASINKIMYMYFTYLFSSQIGILSEFCVLQVFHFATLPRLREYFPDFSTEKWPLAKGKHVKCAGL